MIGKSNLPKEKVDFMKVMTSKFLSPIGVIDIGSNSVRLMISNGFLDSEKLLKKEIIITQLAKGFKNGRLSANSMLNTAKAVDKLKNLAIQKGAKTIVAFATAAVRNADNKGEFIKLVKDISRIDIDVVSGDKEALLGVLGGVEKGSGYLIDVGGASSEVAYTENGKLLYSLSHKVGAVAITDEFGRQKEDIDNYLSSFIKEDGSLNFCKDVAYAIGGTSTCLAFLDLGLKEYDPNLIHGHYMSIERVKMLKDFLYTLTPQDIAVNYKVQEKRANIISGGASILYAILLNYGLKGVIVSEKDNLEGYLKYLEEKNEE